MKGNKDKKSPGILASKSIFTEDEVRLYCQSKKALRRNTEMENRLTKQAESLLKIRKYNSELAILEEETKNNLKQMILSKTTLRYELDTKIEEIRNSLFAYKRNAESLKQLVKEKRELNKSIQNCSNMLKTQVNNATLIFIIRL